MSLEFRAVAPHRINIARFSLSRVKLRTRTNERTKEETHTHTPHTTQREKRERERERRERRERIYDQIDKIFVHCGLLSQSQFKKGGIVHGNEQKMDIALVTIDMFYGEEEHRHQTKQCAKEISILFVS